MTKTIEINWHDDTTRRFITGSVARPQPGDPRRCFYVDDVAGGALGVVPMLVTEGVSGYRPMIGDGTARSATWVWGETLDEAWAIADLVNAELFGLDRAAAMRIVGSSITAQHVEDGDEFEQQCEACGDYFEADEETSLCPDCEAIDE